MSNKPQVKEIYDEPSERMVIAGLLRHKDEIFYDIDSIIKAPYFFLPQNRIVYGAIKDLMTVEGVKDITASSIIGYINANDPVAVERYNLSEYLHELQNEEISKDNVKPFTATVAKFGLARTLQGSLKEGIENLGRITNDNSLTQIISLAESSFSNFLSQIIYKQDFVNLGDKMADFANYLAEVKPKNLGIPTGFPRYDTAIGGGLRKSGVHLIGARAKEGKSFFAVNVASNVTAKNIPVLYLDTELTDIMIMSRWLSLTSKVPILRLETGEFSENEKFSKEVHNSLQSLKRPFYYYNISGLHHSEWISVIRRWLMKEVGFNESGHAKDCLVILDYIKLMNLDDAGKFQEHQYLGQIITDLHNTAIKYNIPILSLAQLNRDGISKEDQGIISGSDRLIFLCSSFSIMKKKSPEDLSGDPPSNGNKKLIVNTTRFGPGTPDGEYINLYANFEISSLTEGKTNIENRRGGVINTSQGVTDSDGNDSDDDSIIL